MTPSSPLNLCNQLAGLDASSFLALRARVHCYCCQSGHALCFLLIFCPDFRNALPSWCFLFCSQSSMILPAQHMEFTILSFAFAPLPWALSSGQTCLSLRGAQCDFAFPFPRSTFVCTCVPSLGAIRNRQKIVMSE